MMKLAILLAALLPAVAHAQTTHSRWLQAGANDKLGVKVFIDTLTITRSPGRVSVWVEYRYDKKQSDALGTNFKMWDVRDTFDCAERKFSMGAWATKNDDGEVVQSGNYTEAATDVLPGSITETIFRLCP